MNTSSPQRTPSSSGHPDGRPQAAECTGLPPRCIPHVTAVWCDCIIDTAPCRGGQVNNQPSLPRLVRLGDQTNWAGTDR